MEENNKMCSEEVEAKENDCKLNDEELEAVTGGAETFSDVAELSEIVPDDVWEEPQRIVTKSTEIIVTHRF